MPAFDRERLKTIEAAAFLLAAAAEVILRKVGGIAGRPFAAWFFGAANGSVWEQMKVLFFSFIGVS
ncbi:MAG: hypothetical protein P4M02_06600, partial [Clostridia bacterium]|nr:hypothetical protein [Clostridia bacterium]